MIALAARNEVPALRLTNLDEILPRQLDAGFDRFRPAADEIDIGETARLVADKMFGQRLRGLRREEARVSIRELRSLSCHRIEHARMLMP